MRNQSSFELQREHDIFYFRLINSLKFLVIEIKNWVIVCFIVNISIKYFLYFSFYFDKLEQNFDFQKNFVKTIEQNKYQSINIDEFEQNSNSICRFLIIIDRRVVNVHKFARVILKYNTKFLKYEID